MGNRKIAALTAVTAVTTGVAVYAYERITRGPITPEQEANRDARDARIFEGGYMLALHHVRRGLLNLNHPPTE